MAISTMKAEFQCEVEKIWDIVTSLEDYAWRSDLDKIVVVTPGKQFEEHTKEGYVTKFMITTFEPYERYEFDMENSNMLGHWTGVFSVQGNTVSIEFTEHVTPKKIIMKPLVKAYLKKQQLQYISDLEKELEKLANAHCKNRRDCESQAE